MVLLAICLMASRVSAFGPIGGGVNGGGSGGTPGGTSGQTQYNNNGDFGGYTLGGTLAAHNFANALSATGTLTGARPGCGDLSDSSTGCSTTVGTSATVNTGTSGATIPLNNTANAFTGPSTGVTQTAGDSTTVLATDAFVAAALAGVNPAVATQEATADVLPNSPAYTNGASGVGATLIATGNAALVVDGITVALGDRVLVKNQGSTFQNGIYLVTATGSGIALYTLTRAADFNQPGDINSTGVIPVLTGSVNAGTSWVLNVKVPAVGSPNAITFAQFSYALANQPSLSGNNAFTGTNTFLSNPIAPLSGGVGAMTSAPFWMRYFGDGREGAVDCNGSITNGEHWVTTFNISNGNTCTPSAVPSGKAAFIIRATGTCTIAGKLITRTNSTLANATDVGSAAGGGGGGTAVGAAGNNPGEANLITFTAGGTAGSASGGNGGNASANSAQSTQYMSSKPPFGPCGGAAGGAGGSTGAAGGAGTDCAIIICPTIDFPSTGIIDTRGNNGVDEITINKGAGGGGGSGAALLSAETYTSTAGKILVGSVQGGSCTSPSITLLSNDNTGFGAYAVITGLTTGGLDATKITITGGSGYTIAPTVQINAGASGLTGSPAAHTTLSGGAVASIVIDAAGSGGTLTTATTCGLGGYGAPAWSEEFLIQ